MVNSAYCFPQAEFLTPHGGRPFHSWKKGTIGGASVGAGGRVLDGGQSLQLRSTPKGDRGHSSSPFWRRKSEMGTATSFGIGDRPDPRKAKTAGICPATYGDPSPLLKNTRRNCTRSGITMKANYMSIQDKMLWNGDPGPGIKYDTSYRAGQASWSTPAKCPEFSFRSRPKHDPELIYSMDFPGPDTYNVRTQPGKKPAWCSGTMRDLKFQGRTKDPESTGRSPGPAKYKIKADLDKYGMDQKIQNTKVPPEQLPRSASAPGGVHMSPMSTASTQMGGSTGSESGATFMNRSPAHIGSVGSDGTRMGNGDDLAAEQWGVESPLAGDGTCFSGTPASSPAGYRESPGQRERSAMAEDCP